MRAVTVSILCVLLVPATGQAQTEPSKASVGLVNVAVDAAAGQTAARDVRKALADSVALAVAGENVALEGPLPEQRDERNGQLPKRVEAAQAAFLKFEFDSALKLSQAAEQLALSLPPSPATTQALVDVHLVRAKLHDANKQSAKALASLSMVARLRPELEQLDPAQFTPRIRNLFAKARKATKTMVVTLTVEPAQSQVWIGGAAVDLSSAVKVARGTNYVRATALGYKPRGFAHRFAGNNTRLSINLVELGKPAVIEAVRRDLVGAAAPPATHLSRLAALADVDILILVRSSDDVLVYDRRDQSTSKWAPRAEQPLLKPATKTDDGPNGDRPDLTATSGPSEKSGSWYTTWWGIGGMAVGAAVVGTLVYFAIAPDTVYGIGDISLQ